MKLEKTFWFLAGFCSAQVMGNISAESLLAALEQQSERITKGKKSSVTSTKTSPTKSKGVH